MLKTLIRTYWKLTAALLLAAIAATTMAAWIIFFPSALPSLIGLSILGYTPFASLATMPFITAAAIAAGAAAGVVFAAATLFNAIVGFSNLLDKLITPKPKQEHKNTGDVIFFEGGPTEVKKSNAAQVVHFDPLFTHPKVQHTARVKKEFVDTDTLCCEFK
jgi:hypothetical protein